MGYTKTKRAVKRVESYLQQMLGASGELRFPAEDASKTAYDIRQGIIAAKEFAIFEGAKCEPFASYASLASKFIVRVDKSYVVCEPRDVIFIASASNVFGQMNIPDVSSALEIIGAAIMHKAPVMIFSDASSVTVQGEDLARLERWATTQSYTVIVSDNHITLKKQ